MTKRDGYKTGYNHGRYDNVMWGHSSEYRRGYNQGQADRRFWDEQSTFDDDNLGESGINHQETNSCDSDELTFGSVVEVSIIWIFIWAPIGLFFGGESTIFNITFWGGLIIVVITFLLWIASLFERKPNQSEVLQKSGIIQAWIIANIKFTKP